MRAELRNDYHFLLPALRAERDEATDHGSMSADVLCRMRTRLRHGCSLHAPPWCSSANILIKIPVSQRRREMEPTDATACNGEFEMAMKNRKLVFALFGTTFAAILYASSSHAESANYITSDCHQGDCARYYLVKTFPAPSSAYPPISTDQYQYLVHVKAIGYCNPGVLDCAKGTYVAGDLGIEIYNVRCSEPGHIRSIEEPNPRPNHATFVSDAIWKKVCGR
jgi:hypothetical protein